MAACSGLVAILPGNRRRAMHDQCNARSPRKPTAVAVTLAAVLTIVEVR